MAIEFDVHEYESLVRLAREGVNASGGDAVRFDQFLTRIESRNDIHRSLLWVLWSEHGEALPEGSRFPDVWPDAWRARLEQLYRPVARADVDRLLAARARRPVRIVVTPDPAALRGFTPLDTFFPPRG